MVVVEVPNWMPKVTFLAFSIRAFQTLRYSLPQSSEITVRLTAYPLITWEDHKRTVFVIQGADQVVDALNW